MLKLKGEKDGRTFVVLCIDNGNVRRLKKNQPIRVRFEELDLSPMDLIIDYAPTGRAALDRYGNMTNAQTRINITPDVVLDGEAEDRMPEGLRELVEAYLAFMSHQQDSPRARQLPKDRQSDYECSIDPIATAEHLRWMLKQMLEEPGFTADATKLHRWIGFIQGVLWRSSAKTLVELRDETRKALKS